MIRIDGYLIDCTLKEDPQREAELTDHPIEQGADASDNMRVKNLTYEVEGIISDTPIGVVLDEPDRQNAGLALPSAFGYQRLAAIHDEKRFVTVISPRYGKLTDMALIKFNAPVDKDTGRCTHFTGTFRKVIFVTNLRTTVRVAVPNTGPKTSAGALQPTPYLSALVIPIYVWSVPISQRVVFTSSFGPPIFTRKDVKLDCYDVKGTSAKPDGWLLATPSGPDKYEYHAGAVNSQQGPQAGYSSTNLNPTINGTPVHYDYNQKSWNRDSDDKPLTHVPPDEDKWNYVTTGKK